MTSPLVPAYVDLRGLPWMRLDTVRLLDSDMFALSTGDEFKAAVALWCKSWGQAPAASLPDDDRILAHLSGTGPRWKKLKPMALRGWIKCDDGRLYHPVVAEQALAAWDERQAYQERQEGRMTREERYRQEHKALRDQLRDLGITMPWNTKIEELRARLESLNDDAASNAACHTNDAPTTHLRRTYDAPPTAKTGRDGTGSKDQEQELPPHARSSQDSPAPAPIATDAGRACAALKQAGCARVNPSHPDLLAALAEGVSPDALVNTYRENPTASNPFAWAIATARGRHAEGAKPVTGESHADRPPGRNLSAVERVRAANERAEQREQQPVRGYARVIGPE